MAPKKLPQTKKPPEHREKEGFFLSLALINVINTAVERFGWPGLLFILCWAFVIQCSSPDEKHQIIQRYVLGQGTPYHIILLTLLFTLTVWAQHRIYNKKEREINQRNTELEAEADRLNERISQLKVEVHRLKNETKQMD